MALRKQFCRRFHILYNNRPYNRPAVVSAKCQSNKLHAYCLFKYSKFKQFNYILQLSTLSTIVYYRIQIPTPNYWRNRHCRDLFYFINRCRTMACQTGIRGIITLIQHVKIQILADDKLIEFFEQCKKCKVTIKQCLHIQKMLEVIQTRIINFQVRMGKVVINNGNFIVHSQYTKWFYGLHINGCKKICISQNYLSVYSYYRSRKITSRLRHFPPSPRSFLDVMDS